MSQALCLVDRATHAGSSRYVPCERCQYRALSSPFSCGRSIIPHSPSLCTVRFSFSWHPIGSRRPRLVPHTGPSLLSSFVNMVARTPASSSGPLPLSSPLFPPLPLAQEAHHVRSYLHSMHRLCLPSTSPPLPVICAPPPFATIRYPWSLLFFFIPIPLAYGAKLRNPVDLVKLGSLV